MSSEAKFHATRGFTWRGKEYGPDDPFDAKVTAREERRLRDAGRIARGRRQPQSPRTKKAAPKATKKSQEPTAKELVSDPLE